MTKVLNFGLKIKRVVGRVAHAKSSDPVTPPKFETCTCLNSSINPNRTLRGGGRCRPPGFLNAGPKRLKQLN